MAMLIHREGRNILIVWFLIVALTVVIIHLLWSPHQILIIALDLGIAIASAMMLWFFRTPDRPFPDDPNLVSSPVDGKVVVIEKVMEDEYFHEPRIQVSIFMSVTNPHVNFVPFAGKIVYIKYHPGDYMFAFHPKSSSLNERTTIAIDSAAGSLIMRQIAGAVARRIVWFCNEGDVVEAGSEIGFIKFGSRIDLLLPESADVKVKVGQKVRAGESLIAEMSSE